MDLEETARSLSALAHGHRLAAFRALVVAGPSGLTASELAAAAGIGATTLTFHMKELERSGLVRSWRSGRYVRSAVQIDRMRALLKFLTEDCCGGRPELCGAGLPEAATIDCCNQTAETGRSTE